MIKEAAIGDTVVLGAALDDLRRAYPSAYIVLFAGPSNYAFAQLMTVPNEVRPLPISDPWASIRALRRCKFDLLFDAGQWPRINALVSMFSGAAHTVGFKTPGQYRHYGYDTVVEHDSNAHEVVNFRRLVARGLEPEVPASFGLTVDIARFPFDSPYAVLHMWPGGERSELKQWPADRWVAVAWHILGRGFTVVLTGGGAKDEAGNRLVLEALGSNHVHNLVGTQIRALPALLRGASLVVSVNTGVMHVAAILGTPTVGLHGPTSVRRWGPYGRNSRAVVSSSPRGQYLNLGFEYPDICDSMQHLATQDVINAIGELLPTADDADFVGRRLSISSEGLLDTEIGGLGIQIDV